MKKVLQMINRKKIVTILNRYSLFFQWILSCFLCFTIEVFSRHSIGRAVDFLFDRSWIFLYNSSIIFATLLLVYFVKRRALARCMIGTLWMFLGIINGCVLLKRVTPFGYTDLKMISDLFQMKNNYFSTGEALIAIFGVLLVFSFIIWLWKRGPKFQGKCHYFTSLALVASCFIWLPAATDAAVKSHLLSNYFSNIAEGYEEYGFVYGFSTSVVDRGMTEPLNYTSEKLEEIKNRVQVPKTDSKKPNIIVVLLESFVDPYEVRFLNCSTDPVPTFHSLENNYSTGYLNVPVVGAGTANTEFEILTGMSMHYFGVGEYPYKTVLKSTACESIADDLGQIGYGTHVVHNNGGNFYSRANAFSKMGFDSFTSKELMNITSLTPLGTWATDDILVGEVEKVLDSTNEQMDFVYTITVQAHGDYPKEKVLTNPAIQVSGIYDKNGQVEEGMQNAWEYYINELHEVDAFIANLTKMLSERDEDTIVVFFGDHLPSLSLEKSDMKSGDIFKTKYVTWNNFGLAKKDEELSSYQLLAKVTQDVGIHEGTIFTYHQYEMDKGKKTGEPENMRALELLQYDLLYGKRYVYGEEERYPASELVMGTEDISISGIDQTMQNSVIVYGNNFTPWCKISINGERKSTNYLSGCHLLVKDYELQTKDEITVEAMGSQSTVFRSSQAYLYRE